MITTQLVPQIDYDDLAVQFLPESHRTPRFIQWMKGMSGQSALLNSFFWKYCYGDGDSGLWSYASTYNLNDTVVTIQGTFISTVNGNVQNNPLSIPNYDPTATYIVGNSVIFGGTVANPNYYICSTAIPVAENFNPDHWTALTGSVWYKIAPSYIGAQERAQYNAQKLIMEWALNRWFRTAFRQPTAFQDGTTSTPYGVFYTPVSDIYITTVAVVNVTFLSGENESESSHSGETDSGNANSTETLITASDTTYKFIVWIPTSLSVALGASWSQIVSNVVNLMALCGTYWQISIY